MQKPLKFERLTWNIDKFEFKFVGGADCWKPVGLESPISRLHLTPTLCCSCTWRKVSIVNYCKVL